MFLKAVWWAGRQERWGLILAMLPMSCLALGESPHLSKPCLPFLEKSAGWKRWHPWEKEGVNGWPRHLRGLAEGGHGNKWFLCWEHSSRKKPLAQAAEASERPAFLKAQSSKVGKERVEDPRFKAEEGKLMWTEHCPQHTANTVHGERST